MKSININWHAKELATPSPTVSANGTRRNYNKFVGIGLWENGILV